MKTKEKAFNDFRNKREEEVYQRIHAVAEKIRLEKGLDILLDARGVFSGGVDITDLLIQRLNANGMK
jgi:Skp family chaperone for outer membrane proteins